MLLDYYTVMAENGESESYEDDDFNLDAVLGEFAADDDDWEPVIDDGPHTNPG